MKTVLPTVGLLLAILPARAAAQRLADLPTAWPPGSVLDSAPGRPLLIKSGDYRLEGTVVGGVLLGAAGLWVGSIACGGAGIPEAPPPSCTGRKLAVGAVGLAVGAGLGYLVGWALPKYRPVDAQ
jgi:hypothetical protein